MTKPIKKSDKEWQEILAPENYRILRKKGTESAFSGQYYDHDESGIYKCAGCGSELFSSECKFNSGSGWPSFWAPVSEDKVFCKEDTGFRMERAEVLCSSCNGHLGHLFDDGPQPTGLRYCINSAALNFRKEND